MSDLNYIDRAVEIKIAGQDSTGLGVNYAGADANGNLLVKDYADGPVSPGTVAAASTLIGGQFNTVLPTLTTTQQSAVQLDSSGRIIIAPTTQGILAEDHNYGTVGANTLRTASQIGNTTGAADFAAGNSSAQTLRVVVASNQVAIPVSQSGAWTVSATQGTSPWVTSDTATNTSAATAATRGMQVMGVFNTTPATLTTGQSGFLQLDSAENLLVKVNVALPTGANTIGAVTQASGPWTQNLTQVGGSAITLGQKTMANSVPVVLASDQTAIPVSQSGTWTVQPGNTANTTPWLVTDSSDGPVGAGTAAGKSSLAGGVFNTVLPTLTNTQQVALQVDSSGRLIISPTSSSSVVTVSNLPTTVDTNYGTVGASTIRTASQIGNATGAAAFGAGTTSAQVLRVVLPTDQTAIPATQSGTWTTGRTWTLASGTDSVSVVQSTSPWVTKDQSDGPVTPGAVASFSQLAGGQFNTALPTLTTGQQAALQVDSSGRLIIAPTTSASIVTVSNLPTTVDTNYGTVGASTIRTASQIGNATGAAAFGAGTTSAQVLRVVLPTDQTAIPASQSGTWTVQQGTPPWTIQGDSASGASKAGNPVQIGGVFNTTQPTVTTGQTVEAQSTARGALIVSTGVDTFTVKDSNFPTTVDTNYGTVGASTLRTASQVGNATGAADFNFGTIGAQSLRAAAQIGNATGAALFGAGTTTAQVLRVVLPTDQTAIPATQSGTWTVQPGNTQNTTAWLTQDAADGPVTPGTVAAKSILIGGQFNTTLPTLTTGQQSAVQVDSSGRLLISAQPKEIVSANNSSTANLAAAATFTGTSENVLGYSIIEVMFKADQAVTIQVQQSTDNSNWDVVDSYTVAASTGDARQFAAEANFLRVLVTNNGGSTTTFLRLQTILSSIGDVLPRTLTGGGQLRNADVIDNSGQYRAQSVTTSAAEALGAATILRNRKYISLCPTNGTIYWGYSNAVTTSSGTPIFKNQTFTIAATDNVHVYVIAGATTDCRITEGS